MELIFESDEYRCKIWPVFERAFEREGVGTPFCVNQY